MHQEQVPRKQGLKQSLGKDISLASTTHQEQVPRKQGLKHRNVNIRRNAWEFIKSKFHENKD